MSKTPPPAGPPSAAADAADLEHAARVRLRPFLGMPPGTYLTVIYGLAVLLALFLLLVYPGIRAPGGRIEVTATPQNVSVFVDGRFAGTTPLIVDAAPGEYQVELTRTGFAPEVLRVVVPPRVLGTLIWRNRVQVHAGPRLIDGAALARRRVAEYAGASHATDIIADAGRTLAHAAPVEQYSFLHNMVPFVDRRQALGILVHAATTAAAGGGPVTPQTARRLFEWFLRLDRDYPGLPLWLASSLPDELRARLAAQGWFTQHAHGYRQALTAHRAAEPPAALPAAVSVNGIRFRAVPGGTLLMGDDVDSALPPGGPHDHQPHLREVAPFLMAETEVTNRQFAQFVAEVPRWAPDGTALLVSEGMAEPTYLASWRDGAPAPDGLDEPVTHVSYHAAAAFAAWLDAALAADEGAAGAGFPAEDRTVRLPTEAEWEWAARGGLAGQPYPDGATTGGARLSGLQVGGPGPAPTSQPNGYGLYDLLGNVWEWTDTWYAPVSYLLAAGAEAAPAVSAQPPVGAERVVRGGSWASERELIRVYSRGAQEPAWATPYLGFRVVIALRSAADG